MNDLGLTLAWLAVQVAFLLLPALALHALASRRGPAAGAWVAALSLGLVVALNVAAFVPRDPVRWEANGRNHRAARGDDRGRPRVGHPIHLDRCRQRTRSGSRSEPVPFMAAAGLGPARARGGRAGGAVPAVGEHPGRPCAGRDRRRVASA